MKIWLRTRFLSIDDPMMRMKRVQVRSLFRYFFLFECPMKTFRHKNVGSSSMSTSFSWTSRATFYLYRRTRTDRLNDRFSYLLLKIIESWEKRFLFGQIGFEQEKLFSFWFEKRESKSSSYITANIFNEICSDQISTSFVNPTDEDTSNFDCKKRKDFEKEKPINFLIRYFCFF